MKDCILRISRDEYERSVFENRCYYTGLKRRWEIGYTVFFARKAGGKDSIIGHGTIREVQRSEDLRGEERERCEKMGWTRKIVFGEIVVRYETPLSIKDALGEGLPRGNRLHGYPLTPEQTAQILSQV
ncbi:MAG: hypothetical protein QW231_03130 [Candidatus Bathyarchaeia archaeon]